MSKAIEFFVPGLCRPAGSKRFVGLASSGKARVIDANPAAAGWKERVALAAHAAKQEAGMTRLLEGPLRVVMTFYMPRPKHHFKGNSIHLKPSAPTFHTSKPDALKLARGVEDACSLILWKDDSQIASEALWKLYATAANGTVEGVKIVVEELPP